MSGVMEMAEEAWERGLGSVHDTLVCANHIEEDAIRLFINRTGEAEECSYCGRRKKVVELQVLMEYITDAIMHFYTDPANFMSYNSREGGYLGNVYDASELLNEHFELEIDGNALFNDIHDSLDLNRAWANEYEYHNDEADFRYESWVAFQNVVKHKSRFLFSSKRIFNFDDGVFSITEFLKLMGKQIRQMRMLTMLPKNTNLYRCRQHEHKDEVTGASHICSPRDEHAIYPNRMSPAGIPMFYGAFEPETAENETLDLANLDKPFYSIAEFKTRHELNLIDLSKVPAMPSRFEQRKWDVFYLIAFLRAFVHDFTKGIEKDGKIHIEYVPTQIITEYFRYEFSKAGAKPVDGIIYPSSKNRGKNACVLFMDHQQSLIDLEFIPASLKLRKLPI